MVEISCVCTICGKGRIVKVSKIGYDRWLRGELIQNALPELSVDDRELLMSGICGECFDKLFGG